MKNYFFQYVLLSFQTLYNEYSCASLLVHICKNFSKPFSWKWNSSRNCQVALWSGCINLYTHHPVWFVISPPPHTYTPSTCLQPCRGPFWAGPRVADHQFGKERAHRRGGMNADTIAERTVQILRKTGSLWYWKQILRAVRVQWRNWWASPSHYQ